MQQKIFVVIPAYNETEVVAATVKPLLQLGYEVVIVDDGSPTDIFSFVKDLRIHYLRHEINLGQGAAIQTGMDYAVRFKPDYIVHFDADGQHNYNDIAVFIEKIERNGADIALGSRFLDEESKAMVPFRRRMLLRTARFINWLFTGLFLTDAHNGFRVMRGTAAPRLRMMENRMAHATEILRLIKQQNLRFVEVPTKIQYTEYSMAKGQRASNSVNILFDLIFHRFIKI